MRAFLVYLGYLIGTHLRFNPSDGLNLQKDFQKILPIALAIEIIHSFLLIHDDIIDKSDMRHGAPTIHRRYEKLVGSPPAVRLRDEAGHYGLSQAILLGDIACFEAFSLINSSSFDNDLKVICQGQLIKTLLNTGYGEALDVEAPYRGATLAQIRQVMDLKTARYSFVGPLSLGAILGGAGKEQISSLTKFGLSCGMAFQLKDDILGVFGDEKVTGKPMDFSEGKNTMLIYKTYELVNAKEKAYLKKIWGNKNANSGDLKRVGQIIRDCGALAWCEKEQVKLANAAKKVIFDITNDKELQIIFEQIADFVIGREK